jgi:hypothetical protein
MNPEFEPVTIKSSPLNEENTTPSAIPTSANQPQINSSVTGSAQCVLKKYQTATNIRGKANTISTKMIVAGSPDVQKPCGPGTKTKESLYPTKATATDAFVRACLNSFRTHFSPIEPASTESSPQTSTLHSSQTTVPHHESNADSDPATQSSVLDPKTHLTGGIASTTHRRGATLKSSFPGFDNPFVISSLHPIAPKAQDRNLKSSKPPSAHITSSSLSRLVEPE